MFFDRSTTLKCEKRKKRRKRMTAFKPHMQLFPGYSFKRAWYSANQKITNIKHFAVR